MNLKFFCRSNAKENTKRFFENIERFLACQMKKYFYLKQNRAILALQEPTGCCQKIFKLQENLSLSDRKCSFKNPDIYDNKQTRAGKKMTLFEWTKRSIVRDAVENTCWKIVQIINQIKQISNSPVHNCNSHVVLVLIKRKPLLHKHHTETRCQQVETISKEHPDLQNGM